MKTQTLVPSLMLGLAALGLSACIIPVTQQVTTGENRLIRVVDAANGRPIAGARVRFANLEQPTFRTDLVGQFRLQTVTQTKTYWLPPAPVCPPPWFFDSNAYTLQISAAGYQARELPQAVDRTRPAAGPLTIHLQPSSRVGPRAVGEFATPP